VQPTNTFYATQALVLGLACVFIACSGVAVVIAEARFKRIANADGPDDERKSAIRFYAIAKTAWTCSLSGLAGYLLALIVTLTIAWA
jgi:hypothetical protein